MDERMKLVTEWLTGDETMSELAAAYDVSRKTAYKWVERYQVDGVSALRDRSRRPHGHPATTEAAIVERLVAARRRFPRWSAGKLVTWLARQTPQVHWPSRTTAYALLRAQSAPRQPRRSRRPPITRQLQSATQVNELWTTDFKGRFRLGDQLYCHPLTLRDGVSRFVLRCDGLRAESEGLTRPCFERAFREYGLPARIRSDNGRPFASMGLAGLSQLSVWWLRLGIQLERITPGHPEQNGSHEQFHAVLKRHTARPPARHLCAQQRRFDAFRREYNDERPHDALAGQSPARLYRPSPRAYPTRLAAVEYAPHVEVRRVDVHGSISWHQRDLYVSRALRGERIGLEEIEDAVWAVSLGTVSLARFDERQWTWI